MSRPRRLAGPTALLVLLMSGCAARSVPVAEGAAWRFNPIDATDFPNGDLNAGYSLVAGAADSSFSNAFAGSLADIQLLNRALTPLEAASVFNAYGDTTSTSACQPLADLGAETASPNGTAVTFTATTKDPFDGDSPATCSPASGSTFPIGATQVVCSASTNATTRRSPRTV